MAHGRPTPPRAVERFSRPRISLAQLPPDKRDQALERILQQLDQDIVKLQEEREDLTKRVAVLEPLLPILSIGRPICAGRCGTDASGGITFSDVVGGTVSVSGSDLRVTFDTARPVGPNGPTYMPFAIAFTAASARFYHASSVAEATFCDLRLRAGGGGLVDVSTTAVNLALFVLDKN
jgi:hypothetical protein